MKICFSCALCLVGVTVAMSPDGLSIPLHAVQSASQPAASPSTSVGAPPVARASALERFLADTEHPLTSYRAVRRMSVVARGGKMKAFLTARTSLDPVNGFQYEVLEESGSGMLRSKVLHGALEAERDAKRREKGAHGALSEANYTFSPGEVTPDGLLRVGIHPRRKDSLLMEGTITLTNDAADLVRLEGLLVKRPSFWTRKVLIVRSYARIAGVRVPITMDSTADILFAGQSSFTMGYEYESINDVPVSAAGAAAAAR